METAVHKGASDLLPGPQDPATKELQKLHGFKAIGTFAHGEVVIAMTEFQGRLIIATTSDIYEVVDKHLVRLQLKYLNTP